VGRPASRQHGAGLQPAVGCQGSASANSGSALELLLFYSVSWNETFNTFYVYLPQGIGCSKSVLRPLVCRHFVHSIMGICVMMNVL